MLLFLRPTRDVAQLVRVRVWGARGRWFESSHPDKKIKVSANFSLKPFLFPYFLM